MIDVTIIQQQQQQQTIIGRFEKTIRNVRTQHKKKKKVNSQTNEALDFLFDVDKILFLFTCLIEKKSLGNFLFACPLKFHFCLGNFLLAGRNICEIRKEREKRKEQVTMLAKISSKIWYSS